MRVTCLLSKRRILQRGDSRAYIGTGKARVALIGSDKYPACSGSAQLLDQEELNLNLKETTPFKAVEMRAFMDTRLKVRLKKIKD